MKLASLDPMRDIPWVLLTLFMVLWVVDRQARQDAGVKTVELTAVYRQSDSATPEDVRVKTSDRDIYLVFDGKRLLRYDTLRPFSLNGPLAKGSKVIVGFENPSSANQNRVTSILNSVPFIPTALNENWRQRLESTRNAPAH